MTRARTLDAVSLVLIALATGHAILTTTLTLPETMAQAEALKGM